MDADEVHDRIAKHGVLGVVCSDGAFGYLRCGSEWAAGNVALIAAAPLGDNPEDLIWAMNCEDGYPGGWSWFYHQDHPMPACATDGWLFMRIKDKRSVCFIWE